MAAPLCHPLGMSKIFTPVLHPRIVARRKEKPVKVADQLPQDGPLAHFNAWLAVKITNGVGTMWCAYAFFILALIGLPAALKPGGEGIIAWIAQTFLQLVLLSIIIVGQNILSVASDKRSEATYKDADAVLHEALEIQKHLEAQDQAIERILAAVAVTHPGVLPPDLTPPPTPPPTAS
jgi:hypothetical protein